MDINIEEINKKHNIDLDPSVLDKLTQIPENLPMWKKSILMLRNQKIIDNAIEEAIANKDPYAGVPEWKKDILKKRDSEKAEMEKKISEEKRIKLEKINRMQSVPEWKKELLTRRLSKDENINFD